MVAVGEDMEAVNHRRQGVGQVAHRHPQVVDQLLGNLEAEHQRDKVNHLQRHLDQHRPVVGVKI